VPSRATCTCWYPARASKLLAGAEHLTSYQFNTGTAKHLFCAVCGVKSFYVPRTNPGGYSVNARCLDAGTVSALRVSPFDGQQLGAAGRAGLRCGSHDVHRLWHVELGQLLQGAAAARAAAVPV
jgi:hypothetical protein